MALSAQVINLIRLRFLHDANEIARIAQIAIVQLEVCMLDVRVLVYVVNALSVEMRSPALDAANDVALFKQKLSEVRDVLAGNTRDKGDFWLMLLRHSLLTKS